MMGTASNPKAKLLLDLARQAPDGLMIEIGCVREKQEVVEDGFSTPYLSKFARDNDRTFLSFDIEPKCVDIANEVLRSYSLDECVEQKDGAEAISGIDIQIAFLFLDSHRNPDFSLRQYINAKLAIGAVVVVDDAMPIDGFEFGKAHFIKQILDSKKHPYELVDTQPGWRTLWFKLPYGKAAGAMV